MAKNEALLTVELGLKCVTLRLISQPHGLKPSAAKMQSLIVELKLCFICSSLIFQQVSTIMIGGDKHEVPMITRTTREMLWPLALNILAIIDVLTGDLLRLPSALDPCCGQCLYGRHVLHG